MTAELSQATAWRATSEAPLHSKHRHSAAQLISPTPSYTRHSNSYGERVHEPNTTDVQEVTPSRNFPKDIYHNVFDSLRKILPRPRLPHAAPPISIDSRLHAANSTCPSRSASMQDTRSSLRSPPQRPTGLAYGASSSVGSNSPSRSSVRGRVGDSPDSDASAARSRVASMPAVRFREQSTSDRGIASRSKRGRGRRNDNELRHAVSRSKRWR